MKETSSHLDEVQLRSTLETRETGHANQIHTNRLKRKGHKTEGYFYKANKNTALALLNGFFFKLIT